MRDDNQVLQKASDFVLKLPKGCRNQILSLKTDKAIESIREKTSGNDLLLKMIH